MSYWTFRTAKGVFSVVERSSRGVDVYFGETVLGHYRSPVEAAEQVAQGKHHALPCAPDDGKTLEVPSAIHEWEFVRQTT